MRRAVQFLACVALAATACSHDAKVRLSPSEARTSRALLSYEAQGPLPLRAFLDQFPKGADLHVHLSGAVYAETFIRDAGEDGLCVDSVALKFAKPPCRGKLIPASQLSGDKTPVNQDLYDRLVDAFSMRSYFPSTAFSGHDQFFSTFARFSGLDRRHMKEWVDEIASRSAEQNQQYLELMDTPAFGHAAQIAHAIGWNRDFAKFRQQLLDHGVTRGGGGGTARMCATPKRPAAAGTLRNAAGNRGLPDGDPLHLPGAARVSPGAGVCADAAWV